MSVVYILLLVIGYAQPVNLGDFQALLESFERMKKMGAPVAPLQNRENNC